MEEFRWKTHKPEEKNTVRLRGRVLEEPHFSNEAAGIRFFETKMSVYRLSGRTDTIPILLPESLLPAEKKTLFEKICEVKGSFRSYNYRDEERRHLMLSVLAKELEIQNEEGETGASKSPVLREEAFWETGDLNRIHLDGFLVKNPEYRRTPLGRAISEILIAVPRFYRKSDYIPCVVWGNNARRMQNERSGRHVILDGRIQSRLYVRHKGEGMSELKTAYEISVDNLILPEA